MTVGTDNVAVMDDRNLCVIAGITDKRKVGIVGGHSLRPLS